MDRRANTQIIKCLRERFDKGDMTDTSDRLDLVYGYGSVGQALLHSVLFVPGFVEIEGEVFLDELRIGDGNDAKLAEEVRALRHDRQALDRMVQSYNWIEVAYQFRDRSCTDDEEVLLAELMAEAWRARLEHLFPDRRFVVRLIDPAETGSIIGLGFEEVRG